MMTIEEKIRRCWNCGLRLKEAYKRLNERHGFTDKAMLVKEWRLMKKNFGSGCVPIWYFTSDKKPVRKVSQKELDAVIDGSGTTYGQWKGITGPGKQLREAIAACR